MPAVRKSRSVMSKAIRPLVEQLENRELLTTVTSTSDTTPTYFEYQDARGQAVRVTLEGNIKVDLIGSNVNPDTNAVGLNGLPGDLINAGGTRSRVGGGFGGENGIMPVTALNTAARTVNEKAGPATEDITDIPSVPDTDPTAPAGAEVGGDNGLGSINAPSTSINVDALASNSAGETYGFNVVSVPDTTIVNGVATTGTRLLVQLLKFDNTTGNATVVEDLNRDNLPGTTGFGQYLISGVTVAGSGGATTTTITQTAPVISSADFYPSDDSKLYFIATVSQLTSNGTSTTAIQVPRLFLYDFTKPLGHRVTVLPGNFGVGAGGQQGAASTVTIYGMTFNPNDNHMWVFATIPSVNNVTGQTGTTTALFDMGDPTAANFNTNSIGGNAIRVRNLATAQDIEFLGNGPGDINNDPTGIYIVSGTNLWRADISGGAGSATTAIDMGPLPDPDDNRTVKRGSNITDITYNPTILNPFYLEDDPTSTRRGVFIGTDAATDELVFIDFRNRHPDSDLYTLYVTKADPNGSSTDGKISIAAFTRGTVHDPARESESPYGTGVGLRVLTQGNGETVVTPGIGGVLLGAQSVKIGNASSGIDAGGVPFNTAVVPANTFSTLPNIISTLAPGLIVAPGVSLNKFLFGGTITGQVAVADSINLFYAGGLVTGDASGGEFNNGFVGGSAAVFSFTGLNNLTNPGNFSFGGELRNLVVGNDVGITGDPTSTSTYSSGFNMHIVGRLGEEHVYGNAALNGVVDGLDNSHALPGNIPQEEVEFKGVVGTPNPHGPVSDFQNFFLSTADLGSTTPVPFANDTTPQYLGTFNSTIFDGLNQAQDNAVQVRGVLQNDGTLNGGDTADEYSVGLLAGQSYQFTLRPMQYPTITTTTGLTNPAAGVLDEPDPTTWVYGSFSNVPSMSLEVLDPLGNVIATDFNDVDANETFGQVGFKATMPGNYTLRIGTDVVTILPTGVRVTTLYGGDQPYELVGANVGNVTLGAVHGNGFVGDVANPLVLTGTTQQAILHQRPGLELTHGNMGVLVSDGRLVSLSTNIIVGSATTQTSTATLQVDSGNLGAVVALNIGDEGAGFATKAEEGNGDFGFGISLHVNGTIGLIRNTDVTQTSVMDINRDASAAMAYELQEILAPGLLYGNIYTNGPIGVIKAGDFGVALGPVMLINANFDNTGNDGTIDLIETMGDPRNVGNFGTLEDGGPGITTGPGGNVRYIRCAGTLYRDAFFGGSQPELTTYTAGATVNLVDDSGSTVSIIPGPLVANPQFNPLLPVDPVNNPKFIGPFQNTSAATTVNGVTTVGGAVASATTGTTTLGTGGTTLTEAAFLATVPAAEHIQAETYPIRGSGGAVIVRLITDGGITLTSGSRATNGGVEISDLLIEQPINYTTTAPVIDGNTVTLDVNNNPVVGTASPPGSGTTNIPATGAGSSKTSPTLPVPTTSANSSGNTGTTATFSTSATGATGTTITLAQTPIGVLLNGSGRIDVLNITGNDVDFITNSTGGEIVNTDLVNLGVLTTNGNVGFSTSPATGVDVSPSKHLSTHSVTWPTGVYPINNQTNGIQVTGNVVAIRSTGAIGNVVVGSYGGTITSRTTTTGNIGEVTANSNSISAPGVFRGIEGNIVASNRINYVNIGQGILPSGTGASSQAGIYALGPLGVVQNNVSGGDIRGNVASGTSIGAINLRNASLIDANVDVFTDMQMVPDFTTSARSTPNFNQPVNNPIYQIGSINVSGNGGIIGTQVSATSIGPVNVGGFGIFDSVFNTLGNGVMQGIHAGGYGIRKAQFNGGASIGSITANTSGAQLPTYNISSDVRASEYTSMDPYFFITPNKLTDIHATLGTSAFSPVVNGQTNQGILEDVVALGSRTLGSVSAFQIRGSQPQQAISGVDQPTDASYFRFGNSIGSITTTSTINGLKVTTGSISNFKPGSDVLSSSITVSSKISAIKINGSLANNSIIQTVGPNSTIGSINIKNDLDGTISTTGKIGTITIGGNLNGKINITPTNFQKNSLDKLTVNGAIVSGSFNVQGSVGQIITMGSLGQPGDVIFINGNLNSLTVGKSKFTNATSNANITVTGNLKSMTVYGAMNGNLTVSGSVGNLSVYADAASSGQKILTSNVNVGGALNKLLVSGGGVSGNVNSFGLNNATISFGNLEPGSSIISGSYLKALQIKGGNLFGTVRALGGDINTINVDGSIGNGVNPMAISANNIKSVHAGGSMFSQAEIDTGVLGQLFLGGDFDAGAIIRASSIGKTTILGANNGQIIIS